jgi:hypothetical protein
LTTKNEKKILKRKKTFKKKPQKIKIKTFGVEKKV